MSVLTQHYLPASPARWWMHLLRFAAAVTGASLLFAILPFARGVVSTVTTPESTVKKPPVLILQQVRKEEKPVEKPVQSLRALKDKCSMSRNFRSTGFSMRFTPDLSVGSGEGAGIAASGGGGDGVFDESDVDEPPRPVSRMMVEYPRRAREAGIEGTVSLLLLIGRNGTVLDVAVESAPSPLFVKPVRQTVKQWKFSPARNQGVPVQVRMRQNITFRLDS